MLKCKKLSELAYPPTRASNQAAGFDLFSPRDYKIGPQNVQIVKTDLSIQLPNGCYGRIAPRSGLAAEYRIDVGAGVIDPDYRGNVGVVLFNHHLVKPFDIKRGDRIAQLICEKFASPEMEICDDLDETQRGISGFGSTGTSALSASSSSLTTTTTPPTTSVLRQLLEQNNDNDGDDDDDDLQVVPVKAKGVEVGALRYIFDVEGFFCWDEGTLIIKEMAFACVESEFLQGSFLIKSPYDEDVLSAEKREMVNLRGRDFNGIKWTDGDITPDYMTRLLYTIIPYTATIFAPNSAKRKLLMKIFPGWKVRNLSTLNCPQHDSPKFPPYDEKKYKLCDLPAHREFLGKELRYSCAFARVQKMRTWYLQKMGIEPLKTYVWPYQKSERMRHAYCCHLKCFDRMDNPTEVDGIACDKCMAFSCCFCECKTFMFAK